MVLSSGKIKKFDVLVTGLKNFFHDDNLNDYVNTIGEDNLIQLFTLVLIKKNQAPVDIGTLFFFSLKEITIIMHLIELIK